MVLQEVPPLPIELVAPSPRGLDGQVLAKAGGAPLSGCTVSYHAEPRTLRERKTDGGGSFAFPEVPAGPGELTVACKTAPPARVAVAAGAAMPLLVEIEERPELPLHLSWSDGSPVEDAAVYRRTVAVGSSGEAGEVDLRAVPEGRHLLLVKAQSRRWPVAVELPPQRAGDLAIRLAEEGFHPIAGKLLDAQGRTPAFASLALTADLEVLEAQDIEPDGSFSFGSYPDGVYALRITDGAQVFDLPAFRLSSLGPSLEVRLPAGSTLRGRALGLEPQEAGRLFVTAWRRQPEPVPGYRGGPFAEGGLERVDARVAGETFVLEGLAAGQWTIRAGILGRKLFAEEKVTLLAGEDPGELMLTLPPERVFISAKP